MIGAMLVLTLAGLWEQAGELRADEAPVEASLGERVEAHELVLRLVAGAEARRLPSDLDERAARAGLRAVVSEDQVLLSSARGRADGLIVVRLGPAAPLVVQAPHAWYDLGTGKLACAVFEAGHGRVLMLNTAQRYRGQEPSEDSGADLAHQPGTVFQAATLGAVRGLSDPLVVQLHGFGGREGTAAVVSAGAALQPVGVVEQAILGLEPLLEGAVLSGEALPELAGRNNVQGQGVSGSARFLHLELSADSRGSLDPEALGELLDQLAERGG